MEGMFLIPPDLVSEQPSALHMLLGGVGEGEWEGGTLPFPSSNANLSLKFSFILEGTSSAFQGRK